MKEAINSKGDRVDPAEMRQILFTIDLSGNFISVNSAGEQLLGYGPHQLLHMSLIEIVAPEQRDFVRQQITGSVEEPFGAVYEIEIITGNKGKMPVEMSMRVIMRGARPVELRGIALPLTDGGDFGRSNRARCLDERFAFAIVCESAIGL